MGWKPTGVAGADHDTLSGLADDDHTQYLNETRHDADDHSSLAAPGSDTTAIHDNVAAEISAITEKVAPTAADLILIEDAAAGNAKKRITIQALIDLISASTPQVWPLQTVAATISAAAGTLTRTQPVAGIGANVGATVGDLTVTPGP